MPGTSVTPRSERSLVSCHRRFRNCAAARRARPSRTAHLLSPLPGSHFQPRFRPTHHYPNTFHNRPSGDRPSSPMRYPKRQPRITAVEPKVGEWGKMNFPTAWPKFKETASSAQCRRCPSLSKSAENISTSANIPKSWDWPKHRNTGTLL